MVGTAPESCFSHTLSASVSAAIHLVYPDAAPLPTASLRPANQTAGHCLLGLKYTDVIFSPVLFSLEH